jgi:hypothetical protein
MNLINSSFETDSIIILPRGDTRPARRNSSTTAWYKAPTCGSRASSGSEWPGMNFRTNEKNARISGARSETERIDLIASLSSK